MTRVLFLVASLWVVVGQAAAFDDQDRREVEQAVQRFKAAFNARDWEAIMPPDRMMTVFAELSGQTVEAVRFAALQSIRDAMSRVELRDYDIDTTRMQPGTTDAGADYAFIPSWLVMSVDGEADKEIRSQVLAVETEEGWQLFRVDSAQHLELVKRTYSQFDSLMLPE